MNTNAYLHSSDTRRGSALMVILVLCTALLIVSTAFFSSISTTRNISRKGELLLQAREGAEAALGYASAELNKKATSLASISDTPLVATYALTALELANLAGSGTKNNLVASSIKVKPGKLSAGKTDMILTENDPAYTGDQSAGLNLAVRSGYIFAKASAKDPLTGALSTSYVSGTIQVREQTWLNYGMFYNMDMEFHPGKPMEVKGAVHTNADMFLAAAGSTSSVSFFKKVTAAGHIYKGLKYNATDYNTDKTLTGFTGRSPFSSAEADGKVYITNNGSNSVEMTGTKDCLGSFTNPANNLTAWLAHQKTTWKNYVMDSSMNVETFSPPGLPDYVAEDYSTKTDTELRNHGYAMIEPQLPATDNRRYYGRKSAAVENLKFSALAGMTIVVEDLDLAADATATGFYDASAFNLVTAAANGHAIPWKLVWYEGDTLSTQPLSKENLPKRDGTTYLPTQKSLDPFAKNDEVDKVADNTVVVKMRRNLKALLRDAIVVVPYRDTGAVAGTFGTGTTGVDINTFPTAAVSFNSSAAGITRYTQPAGAYPALNDTTDNTTYYAITVGNTTGVYPGSNRYPDSSTASAAASNGSPNTSLNKYSGLYDRRQGYNRSTATNDGMKGAMHVVYIDMQKLNWIINNSDLWKNPETGAKIYDFDESFTNLIYVDLPSTAKDTTRFGLTDPDNICPAARSTTTKPSYAVVLQNGGRLPRLPYDESLRTPGFTLATNGSLYTKGNFNADGLTSTGDSVYPDSPNWYSLTYPDAYEIPAMLAADAVTFLSESFALKDSNDARVAGGVGTGTKQYHGFSNNASATSANFFEVSTAIICGLTPTIPWYYTTANTSKSYTNPTAVFSGGVNNLPRFLENLGSMTVRYRGSMAALYESEVANALFFEGPHSYWFAPPTRDWGYHQYLAAGRYPPGTPVIRTARLMSITDITAAQYAAGPPQPP